MESGRLRKHHAPKDIRHNFRRGSVDSLGNPAPGYITDSYGQLTTLERKLSKEKEEEDKKKRKKLKRCVVWSLIVLAILLAIIAIVIVCLYFFTCVFGNCPEGCYDCEYTEKTEWRRYKKSGGFAGKKRHCGNVEVQFSDNSFSIDSKNKVGGGKADVDTTAPLIHLHSEKINGTKHKRFELYWYMEKTVKNNDTLKLVFSDNGDRYAGLGGLGDAVFKPKGAEDHYTLFTNDEDPIYLPFYISRNEEASVCMFVDADGAPMEVTVKGSLTEWLIYKLDQIYFHIYSDVTPYKAIEKCIAKWREIYPNPDAKWTHDFIIGRLTTDEIKTARETEGILGTHYLLSPNSISIDGGDLKIENEDAISDYDKVFLSWDAKQNLKDSGFELKSKNGFFKTHEKDIFYLDYNNPTVKSAISSAISAQTAAGVILQNDFYHKPNHSNTCPRYNYCTPSNSIFFDWDSNLCMGKEFGEDQNMFQRHNFYDSSRRSALQSASPIIVESVAAPGTTHFHRGDLELTPSGLKTCFHNILNLQLMGIRAVSCNMCGGLIPEETDIEQSNVCNRWSQLAFLMPYMIMTNREVPPLIKDTKDSGRYVQNNLNVRKEFRFYLDVAFRDALDKNVPFVYTVGTSNSGDMYTNTEQGVMVGDRLLFVMILEEPTRGKDLKIALPPGSWYTNGGPLTGEFLTGDQEIVQSSSDMRNLIYFKVPDIFILEDPANPDHAIIRVFLPYEESTEPIKRTIEYYNPETQVKHSTFIECNWEDIDSAHVKFTYTSPGEAVSQDIEISQLEVYLWFENYKIDHEPPNWVAFNARGDDKYNLVFDYMERKSELGTEPHSLFETWTQPLKF